MKTHYEIRAQKYGDFDSGISVYDPIAKGKVLMEHQQKRPERRLGKIRNCEPIGEVHLNSEKEAT
jgi:hypothetical protein